MVSSGWKFAVFFSWWVCQLFAILLLTNFFSNSYFISKNDLLSDVGSDVSLLDLKPNFSIYLDIDFDSNMKEMTMSSGSECNLYYLILLFITITCKAGHIISRNLIIIEVSLVNMKIKLTLLLYYSCKLGFCFYYSFSSSYRNFLLFQMKKLITTRELD